MKNRKNKIKRKGDSFLRDALILCGITIVAGLLLSVVFNATKTPIKEAKDRAEITSYQAVLSEGETFDKDDELEKKRLQFKTIGANILKASVARDKDGVDVGYVFLVESNEGYGGNIEFSMGVKKDGTIGGIEIIDMNETPELGAKCVDESFKNQYKGLSEQVTLVKGAVNGKNEVSAISGATITSRAITNAVNQVLDFAKEL